jgi:hypothetical protein
MQRAEGLFLATPFEEQQIRGSSVHALRLETAKKAEPRGSPAALYVIFRGDFAMCGNPQKPTHLLTGGRAKLSACLLKSAPYIQEISAAIGRRIFIQIFIP